MNTTLYFEKISRFDRAAEPVAFSVPFRAGALQDAAGLAISDPDTGTRYPIQARVLATWPDGSAKWVHICFQPDLPGNKDKTLSLTTDATEPTPGPQQAVRVERVEGGVRVDTGPLTFLVASEGYLPIRDVTLNGRSLFGGAPFGGFRLRCDGVEADSASGPVEISIEEAGPLRAVLELRGKHRREDGSEYLDLRGRIVAHAGKPYVEVEHQFIHAEEAEQLSLESLELRFRPPTSGAARVALGQGYYQTAIQQSDQSVEMLLDTETMLYQENEHYVDCFYGDFWVDWRDAQGGVRLSIYQAHQNFPKKLHADRDGIVCALYPSEVAPALTLRGMAKTHAVQLHFHDGTAPLQELSARSLQFQLPDRPSLTREWMRDNNPWVEAFFPEWLPLRFINYAMMLHDCRPEALGMFHFGDSPDAGYTDQGRGHGQTVWVNNEYDRTHSCALLYGLTGERRVLDSGLVAARHWLDVDICHYDPDPLIQDGIKIHTRYHATGGVTPSHEWTEGLLDYYYLTGRREGLEAARGVAENILRHMAQPRMMTPGEASVREGGWALRAMVGMYLGTGEERWRQEAKRLAEMYLDWYEQYGALLAPYTSHSMPRVVFMIALTVNSFARYLLIEDNERVKRLIVENVDDMLAHCLGPDGVTYYKELPSLRRALPTPHVIESLAYAYRITGNDHYLRMASRMFAAWVDQPLRLRSRGKYADESGAVNSGAGRACIFEETYSSILLFAGEAASRGFLDWFEYPY